ncbi:L-aspartate oxidase NadB [Clostridium aceticum]|uniref:L-aspartate oxidase n=1 Tax=Clostridium aceticum TaxID=84022 RepID=A0A0D8I6B9_9CLOT|nr:L-aspartate oxidase [Clostridium aceticum]AKL93539.1 L-aspartate oxidase NadB [Clostridium aceticum]KJF25604.1 L-aspartate oxidase [Clostridium aceticum]
MKDKSVIDGDVIVIGTGIAGLFTALNIDSRYKVILISKTTIEKNNSGLAQGGIAVSVNKDIHFEDTLKAGCYCNNQETLKILVEESSENIEKLIAYGVNFDRDDQGTLKFTREGGHRQNSILHVKDATGKEIIKILTEEVKKSTNIKIIENVFAIDLITEENRAKAVLCIDEAGNKMIYQGKAFVMATGGIGQIYKNTTNNTIATGDGIAMAHRASVKIRDMEFVQFHPTALYNLKEGQCFLISEAVRGEGAILRNLQGEAFMGNYHEMKDLAPRDIVARSIFTEMKKDHRPFVYLDITHQSEKFIKERFPTIYQHCLSQGIDMAKQYIPVVPVEHYVMGGIWTDIDGKTSMEGLYACGECACTGVHGSNRLASNSLLEGIVFGNRVATAISSYLLKYDISNKVLDDSIDFYSIEKEDKRDFSINIGKFIKKLKDIMQNQVSIIRSEAELKKAFIEITIMKESLRKNQQETIAYYELNNMLTVALLIIKAATKRKESMGAHYLVS